MDLIKINGTTYKLTKHARHRMERRKVTLEEVEKALSKIKLKRRQMKEGQPDRWLLSGRNDISIITSLDNVILTVYRYRPEFLKGKNKENYNKKRVQLRRKYGSRIRR